LRVAELVDGDGHDEAGKANEEAKRVELEDRRLLAAETEAVLGRE
jgi:hypothetical protein